MPGKKRPLKNEQLSIIAERISELKTLIQQNKRVTGRLFILRLLIFLQVMEHLIEISNMSGRSSFVTSKLMENVEKAMKDVSLRLKSFSFQLNKFRRLYSSFSGYTELVNDIFNSPSVDAIVLNYFYDMYSQIILGLKRIRHGRFEKCYTQEVSDEIQIFSKKLEVLSRSVERNIKKGKFDTKTDFETKTLKKISGNVAIIISDLDKLPPVTNHSFDENSKKKSQIFRFQKGQKSNSFIMERCHRIFYGQNKIIERALIKLSKKP